MKDSQETQWHTQFVAEKKVSKTIFLVSGKQEK